MLYILGFLLIAFWLFGALIRFGGQLMYLALLAGLALIVANFIRSRTGPRA